jgi:hypothetical protein
MKKAKRRSRRRGHYHRGTYESPIAGECKYRSGWEQKFMLYLDNNPNVEQWTYEKVVIEYLSNSKTKKIRKYYPDFFVRYKDGKEEIIEVKQKRKLDQAIIKKKAEAAILWCGAHGMTYRILTEDELKDMNII